MRDQLRAWLRTVIPGVWSALVAWLVDLGVPDPVAGALAGLPDEAPVLAALVVVYPLLRWVEPHVPVWLRRVLLGSSRAPSYR